MKSQFNRNGEILLNKVFIKISEIVTTFYNRIPDTSYHTTKYNVSGKGESALKGSMQKYLGKTGENLSDSEISRIHKGIASIIHSVIDYPEITERAALEEHVKFNSENQRKTGPKSNPRNNDQSTLVKALAKHLHVFYAVYPEIKDSFDKNNELSNQFIKVFIGRKEKNPNWPKFDNDRALASIQDEVKIEMTRLSNFLEQNHYNQWRLLKKDTVPDIDSSDDEDTPIKPITKVKTPLVKTEVKIKDEVLEDDIGNVRKRMQKLSLYEEILSEYRHMIDPKIMDLFDKASNSPVKSQPEKYDDSQNTPTANQTRLSSIKKELFTSPEVPESNIDEYNEVFPTRHLSQSNVLCLMRESFNLPEQDIELQSVAVISRDDTIDNSLRDEVLKFIGKDSTKVSIALCEGHINKSSGQIEGDNHWTALHLRKVVNEEGETTIESYHMDSRSITVPPSVDRILKSIKNTTADDLSEYLKNSDTFKQALESLEELSLNDCLGSKNQRSKQNDGYSCGYHAVFNMVRMYNADYIDCEWRCPEGVMRNGKSLGIEGFIESSHSILEKEFNPTTEVSHRLPSAMPKVLGNSKLHKTLSIRRDHYDGAC